MTRAIILIAMTAALVIGVINPQAYAADRMQQSTYPIYKDSVMAAKCVERNLMLREEFVRYFQAVQWRDPGAVRATSSRDKDAVPDYLGPVLYADLLRSSREFQRMGQADAGEFCDKLRRYAP